MFKLNKIWTGDNLDVLYDMRIVILIAINILGIIIHHEMIATLITLIIVYYIFYNPHSYVDTLLSCSVFCVFTGNALHDWFMAIMGTLCLLLAFGKMIHIDEEAGEEEAVIR